MFKIEVFEKGRGKMMTAAQAYAYTKRFEEAYTAAMRPLCDELGAAQSAVDVLMFLANNPELNTAGDICKYRRLKPGIVSCRVDELVNDGYLERSAVPGDRRKCRLSCTEKAAPIIAKGREFQENFMRELTRGLTEAQLSELRICLDAFARNMDRITNGDDKNEAR